MEVGELFSDSTVLHHWQIWWAISLPNSTPAAIMEVGELFTVSTVLHHWQMLVDYFLTEQYSSNYWRLVSYFLTKQYSSNKGGFLANNFLTKYNLWNILFSYIVSIIQRWDLTDDLVLPTDSFGKVTEPWPFFICFISLLLFSINLLYI